MYMCMLISRFKTVPAIALLIIAFFAAAQAGATKPTVESTEAADSIYVVSLPHRLVDNGQLYDTLDLMLNSGNMPLAGFELKFGAPGRLFDIVKVLPGELCDSCYWEMFNAKRIDTQSKEDYPSIMYQIVAIARFLPDSTKRDLLHAGASGVTRPSGGNQRIRSWGSGHDRADLFHLGGLH